MKRILFSFSVMLIVALATFLAFPGIDSDWGYLFGFLSSILGDRLYTAISRKEQP